MNSTFRVRPYQAKDLPDLLRICLETADSGEDATHLYRDPKLIGSIYAAPYGIYQPDLAFVVEDDAGVCGYVLGALDTQEFEDTLKREWWPALRQRYPLPTTPSDERTPDERIIAMFHAPHKTSSSLLGDYPSHLHIDLLPRAQGGGNGRRLMETLLNRLRELGSKGVHLGVGIRNARAIGFYRHIGFEVLEETPGGLDMGLALNGGAA